MERGAEGHLCRPPLHPVGRQGASLCPASLGHGHRLPGRHDQVHLRQQALLRGVRQAIHQRHLPGEPRLQDARRQQGRLLGPHGHEVRQGHLELPDRCSRRHQERPLDDGSPLRLPAPEEALFPLHAEIGRPDHGHVRRTSSWRSTSSTPPRRAAQERQRYSTPWGGRSIPWASRTSARWPSSSCCWATWASPAAACRPFAASPTCRARRTRGCCSTSGRATSGPPGAPTPPSRASWMRGPPRPRSRRPSTGRRTRPSTSRASCAPCTA